jgi:hypothetical protein
LKKENRCKQKEFVIYFNKIITEKFPNLEKLCPFKYRRLPGHQIEHIIIKATSTENRERILKAVREKKQTTYKGKSIKITQMSPQKPYARRE